MRFMTERFSLKREELRIKKKRERGGGGGAESRRNGHG